MEMTNKEHLDFEMGKKKGPDRNPARFKSNIL